jgi:hypothetical protein
MLSLKFGGWVQCRLATDPDPYDEPRGVSGYIHAYAGEPDLDRILRFQTPPFSRKYAPPVGVTVKTVHRDGRTVQGHRCVGALVDLLDEPKLEGRNGIVAEDTLEPIYPFRLELRSGTAFVRRSIVPSDPDFPYPEFLSQGTGQVPPSEIFAESGVADLRPIWAERRRLLELDLSAATEVEMPGIEERLAYIESNINRGGISGPGALAAAMSFDYELKSELSGDADSRWVGALFDNARLSTAASWRAKFWLGGWDSEAQCFYCTGNLIVPDASDTLSPFEVLTRRIVIG